MDTTDLEEVERDDDTDTSFTALEHHLFGARYFEDVGDLVDELGRDQTTMLHKSASAADTVVQRNLDAPPPTQVVAMLAPGARPEVPAITGATEAARAAPALAAAGGVFAGVSMVAAGSLAALGLVVAVIIWVSLSGGGPTAPGTVGALPPPPPVGPEEIAAAGGDPVLAELREGIRFPADFAFNHWSPQNLDEAAVDVLVQKLGRCAGRIRVTGHTDQRGTDLTNDTFALARAGEVRRILGTRGVDRRRIEVTSAGSGDPEMEARTEEERAFNRRVVVRCD